MNGYEASQDFKIVSKSEIYWSAGPFCSFVCVLDKFASLRVNDLKFPTSGSCGLPWSKWEQYSDSKTAVDAILDDETDEDRLNRTRTVQKKHHVYSARRRGMPDNAKQRMKALLQSHGIQQEETCDVSVRSNYSTSSKTRFLSPEGIFLKSSPDNTVGAD